MFKEKYLNLASLENWISKWNTSSSIPFPRLLLPILIRWLNFWVYQQKKNETYQDHFLIKHAKLNHQLTYLLYAPCHIESDEKVLDSRIQYLLEQQKEETLKWNSWKEFLWLSSTFLLKISWKQNTYLTTFKWSRYQVEIERCWYVLVSVLSTFTVFCAM